MGRDFIGFSKPGTLTMALKFQRDEALETYSDHP